MKTLILLLAFVAASFSAIAQQPAAPVGYAEMVAATITALNSTGDPALAIVFGIVPMVGRKGGATTISGK